MKEVVSKIKQIIKNIFHTHFLSNEWLNVRLKEGNHFEILIVKLETLSDCYCGAMKAFLGLDLKLKDNANQSSQKKISKIYSELRKSIKFMEDELKEVYTHKYVKYFYFLMK